MVKDEVDVIAATVRNMLEQVDAVVVADNLSTDGTLELLHELRAETAGRLEVQTDLEPGYFQSRKMTALARYAHDQLGAEWLVPFDADEVWYSPFAPTIADVLATVAPQWLVVPARLFDHVATGIDPAEPDPVLRMEWRRQDPAPLPKVACRWRDDLVILQGNHGAWYEGEPTITDPLLVVRHFPYRSAEQLVRKVRNGAAAYTATGDQLDPDAGAHWRRWGQLLEQAGPEAIGEVFRTWYWRRNPRNAVLIEGERQPPLVHDPVAKVVPAWNA